MKLLANSTTAYTSQAHNIPARRAGIGCDAVLAARSEPEYGLSAFRSVVARLTDEMFGLVLADKSIHEAPFGYCMQFVLGALAERTLEVTQFRIGCTKLLFQLIDFVARGRLLFLQRKSCVLDVNHAIVDRLLHFGELQFISRGDCRLCKVNCIFQAGNSCRYSQDRHLIPRLQIDRARPRRNHHSALAAEACVRWEFV